MLVAEIRVRLLSEAILETLVQQDRGVAHDMLALKVEDTKEEIQDKVEEVDPNNTSGGIVVSMAALGHKVHCTTVDIVDHDLKVHGDKDHDLAQDSKVPKGIKVIRIKVIKGGTADPGLKVPRDGEATPDLKALVVLLMHGGRVDLGTEQGVLCPLVTQIHRILLVQCLLLMVLIYVFQQVPLGRIKTFNLAVPVVRPVKVDQEITALLVEVVGQDTRVQLLVLLQLSMSLIIYNKIDQSVEEGAEIQVLKH